MPVSSTTPARLSGPAAARPSRTSIALPRELAPCTLSLIARWYPTLWDISERYVSKGGNVGNTSSPATLAEKVWQRHLVRSGDGEPDLLYIDLHLVHEVTSPQAFDGLRLAGRRVRRPDLTVATADHNVPTTALDQPLSDPISARQLEVLSSNCAEF